jgi:Uma2 family endonuclease
VSTARATHTATYKDILDAPPHVVAEIVGGTLHTHPRPAPRHAAAASSLGGKLHGPFHHGTDGPGGWWIIDEPELHLGDDVLVPDLAGWRRSRMPELPETAWFESVPDWVCEVLSPSTRTLDLTSKRAAYAKHGVPFLWLIDPDARTLEAFVLRDGAWMLLQAFADEVKVRVEPFDAIAFPLNALWN